MTTQHADQAFTRPTGAGIRPVTRALIGGVVLGLVVGGAVGFVAGMNVRPAAKWATVAGSWTRLPEQQALGGSPQTVTLPGSSYDFGGVGAPLSPSVIDAGSIVKVELKATAGRVGVSLAQPDGGLLASNEAIVTPQQGKITVYFRTTPGMGPLDVLLRSADQTPAGAAVTVDKVETVREADIGPGEMKRITQAGVNGAAPAPNGPAPILDPATPPPPSAP